MTIDTHEINLDEALRTIGPDAAIFEDSKLSGYAASESLHAAFDDEDEEEELDDEDEDEDDEDLEYEDDDDEDEDEDEEEDY